MLPLGELGELQERADGVRWVVSIDGNYPFSVTTASGVITITPFGGNFFGNFA